MNLLFVFTLMMALICVSAFRNPLLVKLSLRNFARKRWGTINIIAGLMIGTAIISSSMTIGDTFDNLLAQQVLDRFGGVDEVYGIKYNGSLTEQDFPEQAYLEIKHEIGDRSIVDGMSPELRRTMGVLNLDKQLVEPRAEVSGFSTEGIEAIGTFVVDGIERDTLPAGRLFIATEMARLLDAEQGDTISVFYLNYTVNFTVHGVLDEVERGHPAIGVDIFVNLGDLQHGFGLNGTINRILVSNRGGVVEGMELTSEVKSLVDESGVEVDGVQITLLEEKKEEYDKVFEEGFFLGDLLLIFGMFTIIAGVILIVNIFVMLGEERKSEIGMGRAVGMNRLDVRKLYIYEGTYYGLVAALAGTVLGIGMAYLLILGIGNSFGTGSTSDLVAAFTATNGTIVMSFVAGFLITIGTVYFTTLKIMNLDIIRAIRSIPDPPPPKKDRRIILAAIVLMLIGVLLTIAALLPYTDGVDNNHNGVVDDTLEIISLPFLIGPSLVFLGLPALLRVKLSERLASSIGAVLVVFVWSGAVWSIVDLELDFFTFFFAGLFLVIGSTLLLISNADAIASASERVLGLANLASVTRIPLKYSLFSKFKTGLTILMFALVIFIITFFSILLAVVDQNLDSQIEETTGGFDIMVKTNGPVEDLDDIFANSNSSAKVSESFFLRATEVTFNKGSLILDSDQVPYPMYGIDERFIKDSRFEITDMLPEFQGNVEMMYTSLRENREHVLVDAGAGGGGFGPPPLLALEIGETQEVVLTNGSIRTVRIIGYMNTYQSPGDWERSFNGIFLYEPHAIEDFGATGFGVGLFDLRDEDDALEVKQDIERTLLSYQPQTINFKEESTEQFKQALDVFNLLNAYLGLGLVVGIAGLGIITSRSVSERRGQIGMIRAIGYNHRQVLTIFLLEASYISFLGVFIGVFSGLVVSTNLYIQLFEEQGYTSFTIPWVTILLALAVAVGATFISTIPPSRRASMIEPAEVLRFV